MEILENVIVVLLAVGVIAFAATIVAAIFDTYE